MIHSEETVVLFPFMAQGHLIPFLAFALQIEQKTGYKVIYVNTPLNIRKLKSSIPSNSSIQLVELPFCSSDHNLPPNSENTDVLPYPIIVHLLEASLSLKPAFDNLITNITKQQGHPPLCIIADMFFGWTVDIANELDIFHLIFSAGGAYGMAIYFSLWLNLPQLKTDSHEFTLPDFLKASKIHRSQLANNIKYATGIDPWSIVLQRVLSLWFKSDGILLNTVEELDQIGLDYFRRKTGRPVWAIGPVDYSLTHKAREAKNSRINLDQCTKWLDTLPPGSVLYISFGSQNTISSRQMMELAAGLEASGKNFIWVIRPPVGFDINGEFRSEWLPEGFEERMKELNKGLLVHKWAPQLEILSHKSTCAFLSHCGWNSTLESLSNGIPIIGWPIAGDQFYNTKLLEEEVGVCVEIARGSDSEIKHEDVVRVIDLVMSETEKGEEMRKKARKVKEMIKDSVREDDGKGFKGSSANAIEEFLSTALSLRKTKRDQNNEV